MNFKHVSFTIILLHYFVFRFEINIQTEYNENGKLLTIKIN